LQQRKEMIDMVDFLETEPMVARYAWFIPRRDEIRTPTYPYMDLLTNTNGTEKGVLTETGRIWTYMSSYDTTFYHNVDACIEAEHYISKSAGIYLEQTSDDAGVLDIYGYSNNGELTYNVNIPSSGDYTLRLRMLSNTDASLYITSARGLATRTVPSTSNVWADRELLLSLDAGKQQLTLQITQGSLKLNYFVIANTGGESKIADINPDPVLLYPNPVENKLYLRPESGISDIILSDINGKTLLEQRQTNSVDMTNYPAGIYFLTIKFSGKEAIVRKVMKR